MNSSDHTLFLIFVILTGVSVLLQIGVVIGAFVVFMHTRRSITEIKNTLKGDIFPIIHSSRALIERISPQVATIATQIAEITVTVKNESRSVKASIEQIRASLSGILVRVNHQTEHLDGMLTKGLTSVEHAGSVLESAVAIPVRQANGVIAAIKAVVETYRTTVPRRKPVYSNSSYADSSYPDSIDPEI